MSGASWPVCACCRYPERDLGGDIYGCANPACPEMYALSVEQRESRRAVWNQSVVDAAAAIAEREMRNRMQVLSYGGRA